MSDVSIKEYLDNLFASVHHRIDKLEEHHKALWAQHERRMQDISVSAFRATEIAEKEFSKRLELHNNFLNAMKEKEHEFATIEMLKPIKERLDRLGSMVDSRKEFWGVIVAIVAAISAVVVSLLK